MSEPLHAFWSLPVSAVLQELQCGPEGLPSSQVEARRARWGANVLKPAKRSDPLLLFLAQFRSPIILLLLFAAFLSFVVRDSTDGMIILAIILASSILSWWQEYGAADTMAKLLAVVTTTASAVRDGEPCEVALADIVPGDIILLRAGASVAGDCLLVLCTDKTGTLTEGSVCLCAAVDATGTDSEQVRRYAYLNAAFESGFVNPIDDAIRKQCPFDLSGYEKLDEVPYDFTRKRLSILVAHGSGHTLVVKGALTSVLSVCTSAEGARGAVVPLAELAPRIVQQVHEFSERGWRTLGVAYRRLGGQSQVDKVDEQNLTFLGLLAFEDPPKPDIVDTIRELRQAGIVLKIITGDNELVAAALGQQVGLATGALITGMQLRQMSDAALIQRVRTVDLFAAVEPKQILLTNLLTDLPEMTIGTDRVDPELVAQPRRWDVRFIRDFMLTFGPISSLFDFLTFAVLILVLHATTVEFRTGWFIESVMSASLAVLVIRSRRPFVQSRPSRTLLLTTIAIVALTIALPFTPLASLFDLAPVSPALLLVLALIVAVYLASLELTKVFFYRWHP